MKPSYDHELFECPFCDGKDLEPGVKRKLGRDICQEITCENCGKDFEAIYVFSHFNPAE